MMDEQNLAARLDATPLYEGCGDASDLPERAAAELRRMHGEIERLSKIECEWAALSQDDGKAHREIERERESRQAAQIEKEKLRREVVVLRSERDQARAGIDYAVKLLSGINALLYPPSITTEDGRTMVCRPKGQDPHDMLQELSDRIRALPDEMAKHGIGAAQQPA